MAIRNKQTQCCMWVWATLSIHSLTHSIYSHILSFSIPMVRCPTPAGQQHQLVVIGSLVDSSTRVIFATSNPAPAVSRRHMASNVWLNDRIGHNALTAVRWKDGRRPGMILEERGLRTLLEIAVYQHDLSLHALMRDVTLDNDAISDNNAMLMVRASFVYRMSINSNRGDFCSWFSSVWKLAETA